MATPTFTSVNSYAKNGTNTSRTITLNPTTEGNLLIAVLLVQISSPTIVITPANNILNESGILGSQAIEGTEWSISWWARAATGKEATFEMNWGTNAAFFLIFDELGGWLGDPVFNADIGIETYASSVASLTTSAPTPLPTNPALIYSCVGAAAAIGAVSGYFATQHSGGTDLTEFPFNLTGDLTQLQSGWVQDTGDAAGATEYFVSWTWTTPRNVGVVMLGFYDSLLDATETDQFGSNAPVLGGLVNPLDATAPFVEGGEANLHTNEAGLFAVEHDTLGTSPAPLLSKGPYLAAEDQMAMGGSAELEFPIPSETFPVKFTPPTVQDRPTYLPDSSPRQVALMRFYQPTSRGINVFFCSDGTYVVDTPVVDETQMPTPAPWVNNGPIGPYECAPGAPAGNQFGDFPGLSDTNIPYPWNPNNPSAPYVYITNFDLSITEDSLDPYIVKHWYGGHVYEVDQATALALSAAGFGDCLE